MIILFELLLPLLPFLGISFIIGIILGLPVALFFATIILITSGSE